MPLRRWGGRMIHFKFIHIKCECDVCGKTKKIPLDLSEEMEPPTVIKMDLESDGWRLDPDCFEEIRDCKVYCDKCAHEEDAKEELLRWTDDNRKR